MIFEILIECNCIMLWNVSCKRIASNLIFIYKDRCFYISCYCIFFVWNIESCIVRNIKFKIYYINIKTTRVQYLKHINRLNPYMYTCIQKNLDLIYDQSYCIKNKKKIQFCIYTIQLVLFLGPCNHYRKNHLSTWIYP